MTIEARSKDYIHENFESWEGQGIMDMCADAYEQGAKDQRKIDIEKLKAILNSLMVDTRCKAAIISLMEE